MAEHAHSVRAPACTTPNRAPNRWQDAISSFLGASLFLLAIACMLHAERLVEGVR